MPFLENVTRGRGIPRERLRRRRRALPPLRRRQPDQRAEPGADRRRRADSRGRHRPARLLGQPQLGALRRGRLARRWPTDGIEHVYVLPDLGLRLVLRLPAVPRGHRPGPGRAGADPAPRPVRPRRSCRTTSTPRASCGPTPTRWPRRWPSCPRTLRDGARLVATAHSIPDAMAAVAGPEGDAYERELQAAGAARGGRRRPGPVVRPGLAVAASGPPSVPWLEPDVNDHLRALAAAGERAVVLFPVGFVTDHLEVIWDLDNEARETAGELGLAFARAGTAGTHPAFVASLVGLLAERRAGVSPVWAPTARPAAASSSPADPARRPSGGASSRRPRWPRGRRRPAGAGPARGRPSARR